MGLYVQGCAIPIRREINVSGEAEYSTTIYFLNGIFTFCIVHSQD